MNISINNIKLSYGIAGFISGVLNGSLSMSGPPIVLFFSNEGFDKNFYDFVNSYRVEAFKSQIEQNKHEHKTLLALAYEVGFNSKSSFNRSFNKLVGMSPSKYLKVAEAGEEFPSLIN